MFHELNGADCDGDTIFMSNNKLLVKVAKRNTFKIPVLNIEPEEIRLPYTPENRALVDDMSCGNKIGEICNIGAIALSYYYHIKHNTPNDTETLKELENIINMCSTSSMMAIDNCKRQYPVNLNKLLNKMRNNPVFKTAYKTITKKSTDKDTFDLVQNIKYKSNHLLLEFSDEKYKDDVKTIIKENELHC